MSSNQNQSSQTCQERLNKAQLMARITKEARAELAKEEEEKRQAELAKKKAWEEAKPARIENEYLSCLIGIEAAANDGKSEYSTYLTYSETMDILREVGFKVKEKPAFGLAGIFPVGQKIDERLLVEISW